MPTSDWVSSAMIPVWIRTWTRRRITSGCALDKDRARPRRVGAGLPFNHDGRAHRKPTALGAVNGKAADRHGFLRDCTTQIQHIVLDLCRDLLKQIAFGKGVNQV